MKNSTLLTCDGVQCHAMSHTPVVTLKDVSSIGWYAQPLGDDKIDDTTVYDPEKMHVFCPNCFYIPGGRA